MSPFQRRQAVALRGEQSTMMGAADANRKPTQLEGTEAPPDQPSDSGPTESLPSTTGNGESPDELPPEQHLSEDGEYDLPLDQIFEILKNSRRRQTLHYLNENGEETTLSDVAEHIAALENDTTTRAITSAQRKRVYIGLYQCHLPKMDDMNVVDFDQNRGTIELGPNAAQLEPYLDDPGQRDWYKLYLGVTLVGTILFVGRQLTGPVMDLASTVILVGLLGGITLSAIAHSVAVAD